jgi:hypothetical protein
MEFGCTVHARIDFELDLLQLNLLRTFNGLEARFVCKGCGKRGADVRPDFNWNKQPVAMMGYR